MNKLLKVWKLLTFAVELACIQSQALISIHCINYLIYYFRSVTGFDIDQDALDIAIENILETETADRIDLVMCDLLST